MPALFVLEPDGLCAATIPSQNAMRGGGAAVTPKKGTEAAALWLNNLQFLRRFHLHCSLNVNELFAAGCVLSH